MCNGKIDSLVSVIVMLESMLTDAHGYNQQLAEQYRESQKELTAIMSRFNDRGNELVDQDGQIKRLQADMRARITDIARMKSEHDALKAEYDSQLQRIAAADHLGARMEELQGSNKLLIEQLKEAGEQVRLISERLGACTKSRTNLMLLARKRRLVVADALLWLQNLDVNDSSTLAGRGNLMTRCEEAARPVDYETGLPIDPTPQEPEIEPQPQAGS
jgi:chromosome segregation ATPase